ncbi:hypothetical protein, partial [Paludisphaera rhizosphaerae]|uniref:hypothetical protein n=1 Tax=Paludisphaera rhizosphaerae TaxID=2711216 RepID=UPI0013EB93C9
MFTPDDLFVGFDFDNCLDEHGQAVEWARPWLERFQGCYVETSPSGRGVKVWARGTIPKGGKVWDGPGEHCGIEAYDRGRYFCVTGRIWGGFPEEVIPDRQDVIDDLFVWAAEQEPT